jgi:hypothetical protein
MSQRIGEKCHVFYNSLFSAIQAVGQDEEIYRDDDHILAVAAVWIFLLVLGSESILPYFMVVSFFFLLFLLVRSLSISDFFHSLQ